MTSPAARRRSDAAGGLGSRTPDEAHEGAPVPAARPAERRQGGLLAHPSGGAPNEASDGVPPHEAGDRGAPTARRPTVAVLVTLIASAAGVAAIGVAALLRGGVTRRAPAGLPDAGALTAWGLPACRFAADAAAAATVGCLVAAVVLLPEGASEAIGQIRRAAARWAAVWAAAALAELVFTHSDIRGVPLPGALSDNLVTFPQEQALGAQALLALAACALAVRRARAAVLPAAFALLMPLATGHSGAASHAVAVPALVVHVAAATVWVGGLAALAWIGRRAPEHLAPSAERFSRLALGCFLVTAASGVLNAVLRLHSPADLTGSAYGQLAAAKSLGLVLLGLFGARHRRAVLPRIGTESGAAAFRRLAGAELTVMIATIAVAVALARTSPPGIAGW